jgi:hypothetical protein
MTVAKKPNGGTLETFQERARREQFGAGEAPGKSPAPEEELWTERQVMARYPWSRALLRKWRKSGQGPPFVRCGRNVYYRPAAVREWVIAHEIVGKPQKNQGDSVVLGPI